MYSFAQRGDTRVVDEPLYAHYLRVSGADHPGRDEVLSSQEQDGEKVVREQLLGPCDRPVLFCKQMAHHLVELDRRFLAECANVILTRDPQEMLPSLEQNLAQPTLRDTGYAMQTGLLAELRALGQEPPVIVAHELLKDPRGVLGELCERLSIPFEEGMLSWEQGARPEDGIWAPHWYANVHRSNGFQKYERKRAPFPERLGPLLEECRPHYAELARLALTGGGAR
ncbi:MAG: sulfotransferase family protein [Planctomycetes bacterium]|nr:sulfotransferase family protein [Planctomycetota bacterium]